MNRSINEHIMFYNSIFETSLTNIDTISIVNDIKKLREVDNGRIISNIGGWQSNNLNIDSVINYPTLQKLAKEMIEITNEIVQSTEIADEVSIVNFWCNINKNKDFNLPHFHANVIFSGVYYAQVPEGSGALVFQRPDKQQYFFVPKQYSEYTFEKRTVTPKDGSAVFFPAYLDHYVEPNTTNEERISVAFNFI